MIQLHVERLPEGYFFAMSDSVKGLVAQGRTIKEMLEIADDVAKKLTEAQESMQTNLVNFSNNFDYPLVVGV